MKKPTSLAIGIMFLALVGEAAPTIYFAPPLPETEHEVKVPFLEFVPVMGCLLGESWGRLDNGSLVGEPILSIGDYGVIVETATQRVVVEYSVIRLNREEKIYARYEGLSPSVMPGAAVMLGAPLGVATADRLFLVTTLEPPSLTDPLYLKKISWGNVESLIAPSLLRDWYQTVAVVPLPRNTWTTYTPALPVPIWLGLTEWEEQTISFYEAGARGWVQNKCRAVTNGWEYDTYITELTDLRPETSYQFRGTRDNLNLLIYQPAYQALSPIALADMAKSTWINQEIFPFLIGRSFQEAEEEWPGYAVWQIKAKVAKPYTEVYGKKIDLFVAINPASPLERYIKIGGESSWFDLPSDFTWQP